MNSVNSVNSVIIYSYRTKDVRTADGVAFDVWSEIAKRTGLHDSPTLPSPTTWEKHATDAQLMRDHLDRECKRAVCAVCSMHRRAVDVASYSITDIPNIDLLDITVPSTEEHPRAALTTYQCTDVATMEDNVYCLQVM